MPYAPLAHGKSLCEFPLCLVCSFWWKIEVPLCKVGWFVYLFYALAEKQTSHFVYEKVDGYLRLWGCMGFVAYKAINTHLWWYTHSGAHIRPVWAPFCSILFIYTKCGQKVPTLTAWNRCTSRLWWPRIFPRSNLGSIFIIRYEPNILSIWFLFRTMFITNTYTFDSSTTNNTPYHEKKPAFDCRLFYNDCEKLPLITLDGHIIFPLFTPHLSFHNPKIMIYNRFPPSLLS